MAALCTNRPEGFGPVSTITSPLPTQCFFDTVVVPLPTWLYLLSIPALWALTPRRSRDSRRRPPRASWASTWRAQWKRLALFAAYYFVVGVLALMQSVEVVSLAKARLGVGLLPFAYAGLLAAAALQATDGAFRRVRGYWAASSAFWVAGAAVTGLKIAGVVGLGLTGPLAREDGPYGTRHQFTDLVILGAFYVLAIVAEVGVVVVRRRGRSSEVDDDVVELRSEFDWK
ncbi:hypothetical protein JX265_000956 [Neoarthrinium moseri]|uniref:ABC transporter TMD0 domain-containing protein n=1 Tax=Neoarthrinium moseri TaxID=1658444 RepID=A0A9P9WX84_9PEZI|nr:uncharacterized protein JN550_004771 [Neoarthrinium moseri]KAI1846032.1 hypothetical protein JX266_007841 [Neoarthrinium moseri]KAI1871326.1 hypothetical protein JN550_004771 [Neoarthrinium moseri]KAI1880716.1 hypothetical protein JX265_000956 [Neoarthrinium moseri]